MSAQGIAERRQNLPGYARTVCRNQLISNFRRANAERRAFGSVASEGLFSEEVDSPVLRQQYDDDVLSLMIRLPPRRRLAVILRNQGKSIRFIAEFMQVSVGTVTAMLHASRNAMRSWALELAAKYDCADEPPPQQWPEPIRVTTRADKEQMVRQLEELHGPMTVAERSEIIDPRPLVDVPHVPIKRRRSSSLRSSSRQRGTGS
jgi:hypothetical protein